MVLHKDKGKPTIFPTWENRKVAISRPHRLYPLLPIGIGSPLVESLTGYMLRLAKEHSVTANILLRQEVFPLLPVNVRPAATMAPFYWNAKKICEPSKFSAEVSATLQTLTGQSELLGLTLAKLRDVLVMPASQIYLNYISRNKKWCPDCYAKWEDRGHPMYIPLLWMIENVNYCPKHRMPLQSICPHCKRFDSLLSTREPIGFCKKCGSSLASSDKFFSLSLSFRRGERSKGIELAKDIGEILALSSSLTYTPSSECVRRNISKISISKATIESLKYLLLHSTDTIFQILDCGRFPSLESLLILCRVLGVKAAKIITCPKRTKNTRSFPMAH